MQKLSGSNPSFSRERRFHLKEGIQCRSRQGVGSNRHSVKLLGASFFDRPAEKVAYDLIGCRLHGEPANNLTRALSLKPKPTLWSSKPYRFTVKTV
jgi:hypothetical protein